MPQNLPLFPFLKGDLVELFSALTPAQDYRRRGYHWNRHYRNYRHDYNYSHGYKW